MKKILSLLILGVVLMFGSCISGNTDADKYAVNQDYQILFSRNVGNLTNYYVLLLWDEFTEESLSDLADYVKEKESPEGSCNIHIYDSKDILPLMEKYPLESDEYVLVADHLVFTRAFDGTNAYYPLIDWYYKQCGGTKTK